MAHVGRMLWHCVSFACVLPVACGASWETDLFRGVKIRHSDVIALGRDTESQALRARQRLQSERVCDAPLPICCDWRAGFAEASQRQAVCAACAVSPVVVRRLRRKGVGDERALVRCAWDLVCGH